MTPIRLRAVAVAAVLMMSAGCATQPPVTETDRGALVERIVKAQRLQEQFDQQLAQQRDIMRDYAAKMSEQAAAEGGGVLTPQQKEVLNQFMDRTATLFSGKELADKWSGAYGKDLSVTELQQITTYYESPLGQRDVAASKSTLTSWSTWMNSEGQARSAGLIEQLIRDLQKLQ